MTDLSYKSLSAEHLPLAKKFYKEHSQATKMDRNDQVFVVYDKQTMVGCLRIARVFNAEPKPLIISNTPHLNEFDAPSPEQDCRLLRAVFVSPEYRGKGIAKALIQFALDNTDLTQIWTFPYTHLIELYSNLGFNEQDDQQAPHSIRTAFERYTSQGRSISIMRWLDNSS